MKLRVTSLVFISMVCAHISQANAPQRGTLTPNHEQRASRGQPEADSKSSEHQNKEDKSISKDLLGSDYAEKEKHTQKSEYQKVIDDYKAYLASVKPEVVEEIREYRKSIVKINKQKKELYNSLSQEAQSYLAKEQEMKKRLPVNSNN